VPTVQVTLLGTRYALDCEDPALAGEFTRLLAGFPASGSGPAQAFPVPSGTDIGVVLAELNAAALAAADCLAVHAGVVASGGEVIAFPGPSGIGKTTLTTACLLAGLEYVSDESLCLDWSSTAVLRYPRPLALTPAAAALAGASTVDSPQATGEVLITAGELGARVATEPLALTHVVLPRRVATAAALHEAPRREAIHALLTRSFTAHREPRAAFDLAHRVMRDARAWYLDLGHPRDAAALLVDLLARR
jgi:hypothetical protein